MTEEEKKIEDVYEQERLARMKEREQRRLERKREEEEFERQEEERKKKYDHLRKNRFDTSFLRQPPTQEKKRGRRDKKRYA